MFKPVNRHVLIKNKIEEISENSGIILPEDYKPKEEAYSSYQVIDWADDVRFELQKGCFVAVDNKMIEEICINNVTYSIIQDNYVVGIINKNMG
tara:strand:- start:864 stop:1145 length:282 start_codon:yes stop_codon:yes gene_type:complete